MKKYIQILIIFLTISGCGIKETEKKTNENIERNNTKSEQQTKSEKEEKWIDKHGNTFIKKGKDVSIIPAKYKKTGKSFKVFIFNETPNKIQVSERLKIHPNEFIVFNMMDSDTLDLNNGVKFMFGETFGLEVEDKKSQVSGLGGEFLKKYSVPDEAEWAFVIVPEGEGD